MMIVRFFILVSLVCCKSIVAQMEFNKLDSVNTKLQSSTPVDLNSFGKARIEMKEGTVFLNCIITEVRSNWLVYKKGGALHDQMIDKIKRVRFDQLPYILEFDEFNKGKLSYADH
jgi:hypothetical protein